MFFYAVLIKAFFVTPLFRLSSLSKPTVLQVIPSLGTGGAEIEAREIAAAVVKAGGRALIVSGTSSPPLETRGIVYHSLPLRTKNPFQMIHNVGRLKNLIQREQVDLVHARSRGPAWSAYYAARSLGIPFVTTYHAAYKSRSRLKTWYNSVMARGDRVIAISSFIQRHILSRYKGKPWFKEERVRLIERGIDLDFFSPDHVTEERLTHLRKQWGLDPSHRFLVLPGRLTRSKGHEVALEALADLKTQNVDLLFVGSDENHEPYRRSLLERAAVLGLQDRVKWFPPSPDLPATYRLADFILCPSAVPEGFGRVVAEAQAMGKPVIVSAHGAAPEVIEEGVTGWSFPPNDPKALACLLERLLSFSPHQLKEIGEKGGTRVKTLYDQRVMEEKTMAVYNELLEKKGHV